ncbi:hypothetical protein PDIDSM_2688 [Penicillium digitatum]|nr:hypothetical protein PDIDSM_2688 [Penicillium digitatum]
MACLFRLNLDYSIRSGSHFGIRLEDVDCPLPSAIDLLTLDPGLMMEPGTFLNQAQEATDQAFSIAAMKLAIVRAPLHQRLCSTTPGLSSEVRDRMRVSFQKILRELLPNLQEGASSCSAIEKFQQALLSMHAHSFMIVITLNFVLGVPSHNSQRSDLYEAWTIRLDCLPGGWSPATHQSGDNRLQWPQPTLVIFQQLLLKYLDSLSQILAARYHLGPVAAKTSLVLAVATTVTSSLVNDLGDPKQDSTFFQVGFKAAEEVTAEMECFLKRETQDSRLSLLGPNTAGASAPPNATTPLPVNRMDHALPDQLIQTLFPSECDFYPGSESQFMPDLLWEEI